MDVDEQDVQLDYGTEPPVVTAQAQTQAQSQTSPTSNSKSNYLHTSSSLPPKPTFDGSASTAKQHGHGRSASASASTSTSGASAYKAWSSLNPNSAPKGVASLPEKPLVSYGETSSAVQLHPPARRASLSPHPLQPQGSVVSPTQASHAIMRLPAIESGSNDEIKTAEPLKATPPTSVDKASNAEKTSDQGKGREQQEEQEPERPRERERNDDSRHSKPIRKETRDRSSSAIPPTSSRRVSHTGTTEQTRTEERRSTIESGSGSAAQRILDELLVDMISIIEQDEDEDEDGVSGESDSNTSDASRTSSERYTPPPRTQLNVPTDAITGSVVGSNSEIEEGEVETDSVVERRRVRQEKDQLLKDELKAEKEKKRKRRVENHISEKDVYAYLRHRGFSTALQDSFKAECSTKSSTFASLTGPSKSTSGEAALPDGEKDASYRLSSRNSLSKLLDIAEQAEEGRKAVFKLLNACTSIVQKEKLDDEEKERRLRSRQKSRERERETDRDRERERERYNDRERRSDRRRSEYDYEDDRHPDYRRRDRESGKGSYNGRDREGDRRRDRRFSWDASDDYPTTNDRIRGDRDRRAISAMPDIHEDDVRAGTGVEARAGPSDRLLSSRTIDNRLPTPTSPEPPSVIRNQKVAATKATSKPGPSAPAPEPYELAISTRVTEKDISRNRNSTTVERTPAEKERAEKASALAAKFRQALESKHLVFSKHDIETLKPAGVPEHLRPHRPMPSAINMNGSSSRSPSSMEVVPSSSSASGGGASRKTAAYYSSQPVRVNPGTVYGGARKATASSSIQGTSSTSKTAIAAPVAASSTTAPSTSKSGSFVQLSSLQKADSIYELVPDYLKRQREQKARADAAADNQVTPSTEEAIPLAVQSEAHDDSMQIDDAQPENPASRETMSLKLQLPHKTTSTIDKGKGRDTSDTVPFTSTQKGGVSQWFGGSVEPDLPPLDNNDGPDAPVTSAQDMYLGTDRSPPPFDTAGSPPAGSPPPIGAHKFALPRTGAQSIKSMFPGRKPSSLPKKSIPYNDVLSSNDPVAIPQRQTTHIDPRRVAAAAARAKAGSGGASGSGNALNAGRAGSAEAMAMAMSASPTAMSPIDNVMEASASPPLPPPLRASVSGPSRAMSPYLSSNVREKQTATIAPTSARDSPAKQVASPSPAVNDTLASPQQPGHTGTEVSTNAAPEVDKQVAVALGISDSQKLENDLKSKLQRKRQRDEVAATAKKSNKRVARAPAATASASPPPDSANTAQQRTAASPPPLMSNTSGSTSSSKQTSTNTPTSIRKLMNSQGKRPAEVYARNHAVDTDEDEPESVQVSAKLSAPANPTVARKTTPIVEVPRSRQSSVASSARAGSVESRVQPPPQPTATANPTDLTQARKKGTVARKTTGGKKVAPTNSSVATASIEAPTSSRSGIKLKLKISCKGEKEKETKYGSNTERSETIGKASTSQVIEIDDSSDDDEPLRRPTDSRNNTTSVTKPSSASRPRARPIVGSGKRLSDFDGRLVVEEDPSTDASSIGNASASRTEALHRGPHDSRDVDPAHTLSEQSTAAADVPTVQSGALEAPSTLVADNDSGQAISPVPATAPTIAPPRHSSSPSPAFAARHDGDESGSESYSPSRMPRYSPTPIPEDAVQPLDVSEGQVLQQVTIEETVQISVTAASTIASDPPMDGTNDSPLDLRMTQIASSQSPEAQMLSGGSDVALDFAEDVYMLPDESYSQAIASQILSEAMDLPDEPQATPESRATSSKASALARPNFATSHLQFTQSTMSYSSDQRQNMDPMDLSQVFGSDEEDAEGSSVSDKTEAKDHATPNTSNQISAETSSAHEASDVPRGVTMAAESTSSVDSPAAEMTTNEESQDAVTAFVNEALSGVISARHLGKERLEDPSNGGEQSSNQVGDTSESATDSAAKGARPVAMDFMQTASVSLPASSAATVTANASNPNVVAQEPFDNHSPSLTGAATKSGTVEARDRTPILSRAVPPGLAKAGISGQSRGSLHEASPMGTFSEADSIEIIMRGQSPPKQFNLPSGNAVNGNSNIESDTNSTNVRKALDSRTQASLDKLDKPLEDDTFVRCRYSTGCLDLNCKFAHPSPALPVWQAKSMNAADVTKSKELCGDGIHCMVAACSYSHPSPALRRLEPCPDRQNCPHGAKCVFSHRDHTRHSSGSGGMYSRNQSARFGSNTSLASAATSASQMQMQQHYRSSSPAFVNASSSSPAPAPVAAASSHGNAFASAPASTLGVSGGMSGFLSHHPMPPMPAGTPPLSRSSSPAVLPASNATNNPAAAAAASSSSSPAPQASQTHSQNRTWTNPLNTATANPMGWLANLTGFSKHS